MSLGNQGLAITLAYCMAFVIVLIIWDKRMGRSFFVTNDGNLVLRPTLRNFGRALCIPAIFVGVGMVVTPILFGGCVSETPFLCTGLPNAEEGCLEPSDCAKIVVRGEHNKIRKLPSAFNAWGKTVIVFQTGFWGLVWLATVGISASWIIYNSAWFAGRLLIWLRRILPIRWQ